MTTIVLHIVVRFRAVCIVTLEALYRFALHRELLSISTSEKTLQWSHLGYHDMSRGTVSYTQSHLIRDRYDKSPSQEEAQCCSGTVDDLAAVASLACVLMT